MNNNSFVDWNLDWNYVIQWINESEMARKVYQSFIYRSSLAKEGKPCKNTYQADLLSNLSKASPEVKSKWEKVCKQVPEGRSFALRKAVDNIASQMAGGVDSYDYHINDPYMVVDADTEDLLSAKCEQDYIENKLQLLAPAFSDDKLWFGLAAALIKYCPRTDKNKVLRVNPKNVWFDTKYSATGEERFRGYSTMISWGKLKKMIQDDGDEVNLNIKAPDDTPFTEVGEGKDRKLVFDKKAKFANRKIRSLNGLDIYVESLNKLATSPSLALNQQEYGEYDHDLKTCYNLGWYQTFASDPEKRTNNGYNGDDVELTVMYDLDRKIEFKIINRRFVVSANSKAFHRKIYFSWTDPRTGLDDGRIEDFYLDCPLKFSFQTNNGLDTAPHPWSIVFSLLDDHDELCGWRARRNHVSKILSILRIDSNGADAESLKGVLNIMGVTFDDLQGDITSIQLAYDYNPIDSEIQALENRIQQLMHAYDQFDALQAMGDRASAAESGMAQWAVAQGLSVHQNSLMDLFADIARQCIANRVAYSPRQEFPVVNNGGYSSITIQQMALNATIDVKPKLVKQVQQKQLATNALAVLGNLSNTGLLNKQGMAYLLEAALMGQVPRKLAETFIEEQGPSEQELALASQQAQNDAMALQQNQQMYEQNPIPYEVENAMQNASPDEIDTAIADLGAEADESMNPSEIAAQNQNLAPQTLDMQSQDGAMAMGGTMDGMSTDLGSMLANPNGNI